MQEYLVLIISDGWICGYKNRENDYRGGVSIGNQIDTQIFIRDVKLVLKDCKYVNGLKVDSKDNARFYDSKSFAGACFIYDFPAFLSRCIASLEGMMVGKNILQEPTLPVFLETAPKSIIREFLGGLFGGDGTAPHFSSNEIKSMEFKWKCIESKLALSIERMKKIQHMLKILNVSSSLSQPLYLKTSKAIDGENRVRYGLTLNRTSDFIDNIGFRYCSSKQCKLSSASSFWKAKSYLGGYEQGKFQKSKISSEKWLIESQSKKFFEKGSHCVGRYDNCIPYFFTKISSIKNNGVKGVYDITVDKLHSFITNGLVVHNCGMIFTITRYAIYKRRDCSRYYHKSTLYAVSHDNFTTTLLCFK